ncbi:MAG: isoamylase early set domain-containing protein [Saprospiraceae bacterium]|nr:isoamylase early set domain-containing protein [Saprospiraceae bacterium]
MSLTKKFLKSKPVCKVTFKLQHEAAKDAKSAALVGDFNNWNPKKVKMTKLKNGAFTTTLDLETGKEYAYRYMLDGKLWVNDEAADKYVPAGVGSEENCVVEV